jgi:UDP-glucose 4-epimerase
MICVVTGCAGFIGSNLVDSLLAKNHQVIGIDNLSTGNLFFLEDAIKNKKFNFIEIDLKDYKLLDKIFYNSDIIFHLSANADIKDGLKNPRKDLEENTLVTFNVLNAMREQNVKKIVFASTGSIYGEALTIPTSEDSEFPIQTSLYGASKLACEGLIASFCEGYNFQSWIFRFVGILGKRYTHGHVFDFYKKLLNDPKNIHILGNGQQRKSYLHIDDCINGINYAIKNSNKKVNIFNLGLDEYCKVNDSLKWIIDELELKPNITYEGGERGWVGDSPFIYLNINKIKKLGWVPKKNIKESVLETIKYLKKNKSRFF